MLNTRLKAAHTVRDAYMPLKQGVATLSRQAAECAATMAVSREAAGLRIGHGAGALARVQRAGALIAEAEALIADAHPELGAMIHEAGLSRFFTYGYGSEDTVEPEKPPQRQTGQIVQVA